VGDDARWGGEAMGLGGGVKIAPQRTWLNACSPALGIDFHPPHLREIDNNSSIAERAPCNVVASSADRKWQAVLLRVAKRRGGVSPAPAADDHGWSAIDSAVPDLPRRLVFQVAWPNDGPSYIQRLGRHVIAQ
jgi:hypothetical protein